MSKSGIWKGLSTSLSSLLPRFSCALSVSITDIGLRPKSEFPVSWPVSKLLLSTIVSSVPVAAAFCFSLLGMFEAESLPLVRLKPNGTFSAFPQKKS